MQKIIETRSLTKKFGSFTAVDNIAISVHKGEIYGFLGLNGAGKTTTIRMLLGMIRPSAGECFLNGIRVAAGVKGLWNKVGYLVEIPYSYPELSVRENLEIVRRLRFIPDAKAVDAIMERLNITQYAERQAKHLSLGNAQRLGLAKTMMHNPEILILDEPANGLDPAGIVEIRELLHGFARDNGVTIFISSHILGEISKFATRIGIIHKGRILQEISTADLVDYRKHRLLIGVRDEKRGVSILSEKGISAKISDDRLIEITDENAITDSEKINVMFVQAGCPPSMIRIEEEDLESYFLRVIGNDGGAQ